MKQHTAAKQHYWQHPSLPFLELRETENSTKAYKAHSHHTFNWYHRRNDSDVCCWAGRDSDSW